MRHKIMYTGPSQQQMEASTEAEQQCFCTNWFHLLRLFWLLPKKARRRFHNKIRAKWTISRFFAQTGFVIQLTGSGP
jgi:hypothetical protein